MAQHPSHFQWRAFEQGPERHGEAGGPAHQAVRAMRAGKQHASHGRVTGKHMEESGEGLPVMDTALLVNIVSGRQADALINYRCPGGG